ncbi:MAG: hypothetical protein JWN58_847 [Gammaproteobacteria bacterium]|nr:hypothetical protein [Gammaproteobacteria bacterium]
MINTQSELRAVDVGSGEAGNGYYMRTYPLASTLLLKGSTLMNRFPSAHLSNIAK